MPKITISLDGILSDAQIEEIRRRLKDVAADPLEGFCRAAIAESAEAILSRRPESAAITPQSRLYRLIKHACNGHIPSETVIGALFGIPDRKALTMLSNVTRRYGEEFGAGWKAEIQAAFASKETTKNPKGITVYRFTAPQTVIDYLKQMVASLKRGKLVPIQKVRDKAEQYDVEKDTYDAICIELGIT